MTMRHRLAGATATLLIVTLLVGTPWLLLNTTGSPIPTGLPSIEEVGGWLTRPDDGTVALGAIRYLAWIAWLVLAVMLLVEIVAAARGLHAPQLPGLRVPQQAVSRLVATAALLFLAVPVLTNAAAIAWAEPASPASTAPLEPSVPAAGGHRSAAPTPVLASGYVEHVVTSGDTLSGLAGRFMGDASRWPEIFQASTEIRQPGGHRLIDPDLILPGWTLRIPTTTSSLAADEGYTTHVVTSGDTLSGLAQTYMDDGSRWQEIFTASTAMPQPGGRHLTNPNLIIPGWTLRIPTEQAPSRSTPSPTSTTPEAPVSSTQATGSIPPTVTAEAQATAPVSTQFTKASSAVPTATAGATDQEQASIPEPSLTRAVGGLSAPWLLTGFTIGGAVLAGSALLVLRRRRQQRFRLRRPGFSVATPAAGLAPVEKTITVVGSVTAPSVEFMDRALRLLAADRTRTNQPMPALHRVELTDQNLFAVLTEPMVLQEPWQPDDDEGRRWRLPTTVEVEEESDQPTPYPLLVTCGTGDDGRIVLLNLELVGTLTVTGDQDYGLDVMRYIAAELAVNPWSRDVKITCLGVAEEITAMNSSRFSPAEGIDKSVVRLQREATTIAARLEQTGTDMATARTRQLADEVWGAQVLFADGRAALDHGVQQLVSVVADHPGTIATAILVTGPQDQIQGTELHLTPQGRMLIPDVGLDLVAVGLTGDEARGCAALLAQVETAADIPMPASPVAATGDRPVADDAEAPRPGLIPAGANTTASEPGATLPETEQPAPHAHKSGTPEDSPAPIDEAPGHVQVQVDSTDPDLDHDVRDWFAADCDRPRLALMGPVGVRAPGGPSTNRLPFLVEVLAYLALREHGATAEEMAADFGYTTSTIRTSIKTVRDWLGTNPRTGERHLPEATKSRAASLRGVPVYEVDDLLVDIDLFRRLRVRGDSRGRQGTKDLVTALRLVSGRPFSQLRPNGWSWLFDLNTEHHIVCAITDVAHQLTEHFLEKGDLARARAATETALLAAPYDAMTKLDLATVTKAEGHPEEAQQIVREVCDEPDEDGLPSELNARLGDVVASIGSRRAS